MSVYTGEYYEHTMGGASQSIYYSFTPKPLMSGRFYTVDEELLLLLTEAHRAIGILEGSIINMPDRNILLEFAVLKECHYSRQIDYPDTSLYALLESRGCDRNIGAVQNVIQAQEEAFAMSIDLEYLCKIYGFAKYGPDLSKQVGLRSSPLFWKNTITNLRKYNPTAPENIFPALEDIFLYLQQGISDVLIKAALVHYQFEMINPLENHNGIVGRILIPKMIMDNGLRAAPYLSLSELLYESKNDYFDLLSSTQESGGYARWIKFFAGAVYKAARRRVEQIERHRQIVHRDEKRIRQFQPPRTHNVLKVFKYWARYLISNIKQSTEELKLSYNAVERAVTVMTELGILKQITEAPRYRKYMYSELGDLYLGQPLGAEQPDHQEIREKMTKGSVQKWMGCSGAKK